MRTALVVFGMLVLILTADASCAAEIDGQEDARFQSALALWLEDDEETALPEFAALAAGGNRAAQVLLTLIDTDLSFQGPWLAGLSRQQRNALLRAPGGLSGRSWMQAAAEDTPFAELWLVQATHAATPDTALAFATIGEQRAARKTLWALSRGNYRGYAAVADDPNFPPDMRYLIWREWSDDPDTRGRAEAEVAALPPGDPQATHFDQRAIDLGAFDDWLATAQLAALLREPCEALCPDRMRSCTRAAYELVSAPGVFITGRLGLLLLGSPSELLIAPELWNASPRGRTALLRQTDIRSDRADELVARVGAMDACLAAALAEEAARFSN